MNVNTLPIVYGQAPARDGDPSRPLVGPGSGLRLERLLGVPVDFRNLLHEWPGYAKSGGDVFPLSIGRLAAMRERQTWPKGGEVILLGRNVAKAFMLDDMRFGETRVVDESLVTLLPHPSGVSRWWNDEANRLAARAAFDEFSYRVMVLSTEEAR